MIGRDAQRRLAVVFQRSPWRESISGGRGTPPTFLVLLLAGLAMGMLADAFVELHSVVAWLRLHPRVWEDGQLWRVVTFGLVGAGGLSLRGLLQLVLVHWFTLELCVLLGVRRTKVLLAGGIVITGMSAATVQFTWEALGGVRHPAIFHMIQGQHAVLALVVAAFASANPHATLVGTRMFFGMPLPTKWLIPLQLFIALATFAAARDVGGFAGVLVATLVGAGATRARSD